MKYFKKWNEVDNFGKVLVLMAILAFVGWVFILGGYEIVGLIMVYVAVVINIIIALVIVGRRWRPANEDN